MAAYSIQKRTMSTATFIYYYRLTNILIHASFSHLII